MFTAASFVTDVTESKPNVHQQEQKDCNALVQWDTKQKFFKLKKKLMKETMQSHRNYAMKVVFVQSPSRVRLFATPLTAARQASLSLSISLSLLKLMSIESVTPSNHLILYRPLILLPSMLPSIRDFSMSQLFALDDQNTGASASSLVLPVSIQGGFPLGLTGLKSGHESSQTQKCTYSVFLLYEVHEQTKLINGDRNKNADETTD